MSERPEELFPILYGYRLEDRAREVRRAGVMLLVLGIPWSMIAPHEMQARTNHGGQTLRRLAERGGLGADEAIAVLNDRRFQRMTEAAAQTELAALLTAYQAQRMAAEIREGT